MLVSYSNTAGGKVAAFEVISLYGVIHPLSIIIIWHVLEEGQGACLSSLLSLVPPSCMVAPNRELANTLFPFDTSTLFNPMVQNNINMDMDIDTPRGRSAIPSAITLESCWHIQVSLPFLTLRGWKLKAIILLGQTKWNSMNCKNLLCPMQTLR